MRTDLQIEFREPLETALATLPSWMNDLKRKIKPFMQGRWENNYAVKNVTEPEVTNLIGWGSQKIDGKTIIAKVWAEDEYDYFDL